jgi:predicted permease
MALRVALGAGRWLVIRHLVLESLVLIVAGVSVGLALASAGDRLLILLFQARSTGFELPISPDGRVLLFASIVSAVVLVVAALWPAWRDSDVDTAAALKEGGRSVAGKRSGTRRVLIAAQIALTLVLLSGASIFIQLLRDLQAVPLGFETEGLLNAQLLPLPGGYRDHFDQDSYYRKLLEDTEALPGVQSAALSRFAPLFSQSQPELVTSIQRETSTAQAERIVVSDSFFSTMRIPLLAGSSLPHDDRNSAVKNAMISQSLATKLFGSGDAIGQRLSLGSRGQRQEVAVSGIAADALLFGARAPGQFAVYVDYWQYPEEQKWPVLLVRTAGDPGNFLDTIRKKVRAEGHEYPLYVRTLPYQRNMSLMQERLLAWLATGFGIVALTLAAIGLQGLLTYYVNSRTAEIGTRMALGAEPRNVQWLVLREALLLIASGAVAGLIVTAALLRVVPSLLYESHGIGAAPLAMATFSLLMVGVCAAWFPAWRASRLDPIAALRHE